MFLPRETGIETVAAPEAAAADFTELEFVRVSMEEYEDGLRRLRRAGYLALHAEGDLFHQHHLAIHPETADIQLWWTGLADVDQHDQNADGTLTGTMQAHGAARVDGYLKYRGVNRRPAGRLRFLRKPVYEYVTPAEIQLGDQIAMDGPDYDSHNSYPITLIEQPL